MTKTLTGTLVSMFLFSTAGLVTATAQEAAETASSDEQLPELEAFIAEESADALNDTVLPTERSISSDLFGDTGDVMKIPRSVTLLSPEVLEQFNINDLDDLQKVAAGTQQANFYGITGTPQIRGVFAGTFLNGMKRAFNRNEMPLSFGSLEAIDLVKGVAPASHQPTRVGGFVNLVPKMPYFDKQRGSIEAEVGSYDHFKLEANAGGPFALLGDIPAAFRISVTGQQSESFYDRINNDYTSFYGSIKFKPKDNVEVLTGAEFFNFKSNENAGWNRITQNLIDDNKYIIGSPIDVTSPAFQGFADRNLTGPNFGAPNQFGGPTPPDFTKTSSFGVEDFHALAVPKSVVNSAVSNGTITGAQRDMLLDLEDPGDLGAAYGTSTNNSQATQTPQKKFRYTQQYIDSGGEIFTREIDESDVLSDDRDEADSQDFVWFGDITVEHSPDREFVSKNFFEYLDTEKLSSYGYAFNMEQTVLASKFLMRDRALIPKSTLTLGVGVRYEDAEQLQDFDSEPFKRRDLTGPITANSVILAGPQAPSSGPNAGQNFFSATGGASSSGRSETIYGSVFGALETNWTESLFTHLNLRAQHADFDLSLPGEIDRATAADKDAINDRDGNTEFINVGGGLSYELLPGVVVYGAAQHGTSMAPTQGGVIQGEESFNDAELYEGGIKASFFNGQLFSSLAYYDWEQSSFDERGGSSFELEGEGVEFELNWRVTENLSLVGSYTWQEAVRVNGPGSFRAAALSEEEIALSGGVLTPTTNNSDVPSNEQPGFPKTTIKLKAIYDFGNGFGISGGPRYSDSYDLNFERTLEAPSAIIWDFGAYYENESWRVDVSVENAFDEDYFIGADPGFASNTIGTPGTPTEFSASVTYKF